MILIEEVFLQKKKKKGSDSSPTVGRPLRRFASTTALPLLLLHEQLLQPREPRHRLLSRPLLHPVVEEHPLQVVVLVEEDAPGPAVERRLELGTIKPLGLDLDDRRALSSLFFLVVILSFIREHSKRKQRKRERQEREMRRGAEDEKGKRERELPTQEGWRINESVKGLSKEKEKDRLPLSSPNSFRVAPALSLSLSLTTPPQTIENKRKVSKNMKKPQKTHHDFAVDPGERKTPFLKGPERP